MAANLRLLVDVSGHDSSDAATICPSDCSQYQDRTCTQPCISLCESICGAYSPVLAPSPSDSDFIPTPLPVPNVKHMLFVTVSVSALAAAFVFFTFLAIRRFCNILYNRRRQRRRESRNERFDPDQFVDQDLGPIVDHPIWHIRTVGLQPSIISKIAVVRYKKGDAPIEGTDCAVCLSEFQDGESLRILPKCNHPFHLPCIDTWLRSHTNCPICRSGIVENPTRFPSGDTSGHTSDEDEINRESEMTDTDNNNDNDSELRIEIHDSNESVTGQKMDDDTRSVGRSVSMVSRIGNGDQNPVSGISERLVMETGVASSSSPASSSSVQRSASCDSKVFPPR